MDTQVTNLTLLFASPKVLVEKEVWSYSVASFVADCGGLLGLFVGFNFLMILDFILFLYKKILSTFHSCVSNHQYTFN